MSKSRSSRLLAAADIAALEEIRHVHQFNDHAVRLTRSLGDAAGLERVGIHLVRLPPGHDSTQFHTHSADEEFIYILEGHATAELGEGSYPVGPGDFIGLPVPCPAHNLRNDTDADCVYLVGGERNPHDVVTYPRIRRTMLKGPRRWIDWDDIHSV